MATAPADERRLTPVYPDDKDCPPVTSLFSSWDDLDGSKRDEPHTGIDAGRLGDAVIAPAAGQVIAVWRADWGWGDEGALLIQHSKEDLNLDSGPEFYYSEFDHLRFNDIRRFAKGRRIKRGERLAPVFRPGGDPRWPPEVHWEVWSIEDPSVTEWRTNEFGRKYWVNKTGHLIDPLSTLALNAPASGDTNVKIPAFDKTKSYGDFRGFTYILACSGKKRP